MSVLADDDELVLVITQITEYPGMASHSPNWLAVLNGIVYCYLVPGIRILNNTRTIISF